MPRHRETTRTAESIRGVLARALSERGLSRRLERGLPRHIWREAVGPGIAERATPTVLSGGVLHLLVEDHRWRDQLDAARVMLIERVNARLGKPLVRELRFGLAHAGAVVAATGLLAAPRAPAGAGNDPAAPAAAEVPGAEALHPELRAAFNAAARAAAAARARARSS
jgi:predicted nucleic acid-binding Zn ribbon protein